MRSQGRSLRYTPRAAEEVRGQVAYYAAKADGLELRFVASLQGAERLALSNPPGFAAIDGEADIHAVLLRRFPFRLMYAVRSDAVLVIALAHTARKPGQFVPGF